MEMLHTPHRALTLWQRISITHSVVYHWTLVCSTTFRATVEDLGEEVEVYPGFSSKRRLGVFLLPVDGMLVHRRSLPRNLLGSPTIRRYPFIWSWLWVERGTLREALWELSVLLKNTGHCAYQEEDMYNLALHVNWRSGSCKVGV